MYQQALERAEELSNFVFLLCGIVFVLCLVVIAFWKKFNADKKEHKQEIAAKDEIISKNNADNLETIVDNTAAMVTLNNLITELRNDIKHSKNGN